MAKAVGLTGTGAEGRSEERVSICNPDDICKLKTHTAGGGTTYVASAG